MYRFGNDAPEAAKSPKPSGDGLLDIGGQCEFEGCSKPYTFLPFKCKGCHHTFCEEHQKRAAHACPVAVPDARCPAVAPLAGAATTAGGKKKKGKGKRCVTCRKKQGLVAMYCQDCGSCVCATHRFAADHNCAQIRAQNSLRRRPAPATPTRVPAAPAAPSRVPSPPRSPPSSCAEQAGRGAETAEWAEMTALLAEMGFSDADLNRQLLTEHQGNVQRVIECLTGA